MKLSLNCPSWDERNGRVRGHLLRASSAPEPNGSDSHLNTDAAE